MYNISGWQRQGRGDERQEVFAEINSDTPGVFV